MKQFWIGFGIALALFVAIVKGYYRFPQDAFYNDLAVMQYGILFMAAGIGVGILIPKVKMKVAFGIFAAVAGAILMLSMRKIIMLMYQFGWL